MALDGVAWAIGQDGAEMPVEVLRTLSHIAADGLEGVVGPEDLKIRPTATPSPNVRWLPGSGTVANRQPGATSEMYVVRNSVGTAEVVTPIPPKGAGGARSDLVIYRVEDPQYGQYNVPANVADGPYVFDRVITGVPSNTRTLQELGGVYATQSGYAVARIDRPSSAGAINNVEASHIVDLRELISSPSKRVVEPGKPSAEDTMLTEVGRVWPNFTPLVYVPRWATGATGRVDLGSIGVRDGASQGVFALVMGGFRSANTGWDVDGPATGGSRINLWATGGWNDIRSLRGQWVTIQVEARREFVNLSPGHLVTLDTTQMAFAVDFFKQVL